MDQLMKQDVPDRTRPMTLLGIFAGLAQAACVVPGNAPHAWIPHWPCATNSSSDASTQPVPAGR